MVAVLKGKVFAYARPIVRLLYTVGLLPDQLSSGKLMTYWTTVFRGEYRVHASPVRIAVLTTVLSSARPTFTDLRVTPRRPRGD